MISSFLFLGVVAATSLLVLSLFQSDPHLEHPFPYWRHMLINKYMHGFEMSKEDAVEAIKHITTQKEAYEAIQRVDAILLKEEKKEKRLDSKRNRSHPRTKSMA